jgi:cytochrome P450
MSSWMLHQDELYFPNALTFDPTRWLDPLEARRIDKAFVAFGKGSRGCVGLKYPSPHPPSFLKNLCLICNFF